MAGVDAELRWGDEPLELTHHSLDARIEPRNGPFSLRPFERDGDDYVLTVPARAEARVRTANGVRTMATLRVLGHLTPHPTVEGSAQIRLRLLRDADHVPSGVVLTDRIEAWLCVDDWTLRVSVSEEGDLPVPPRFERGALHRGLALSAFVVTLFAGVLSAFGAVPPRRASLELVSLEDRAARLPLVRLLPPEHASVIEETKHDVAPRAIGGGEVVDVFAPPASALARRPQTPAPERGAQAEERPAAEPEEASPRAASWRGPAEGYGGGLGRQLTALPPRVRFRRSEGTGPPPCRRIWSGGCANQPTDRTRRQAIARVVRRHRARLWRCYERGLDRQPGLAGQVTLRFSIAYDGVVHRVEITHDELRAPDVTECLRREPLRWRFPSLAGRADVSYPIVFRAAEVERP